MKNKSMMKFKTKNKAMQLQKIYSMSLQRKKNKKMIKKNN